MSIIDVAPRVAASGPASYGGSGRRCAATSAARSGPGAVTPAFSSARPAAAAPTFPVSATTSPGLAPRLVTGSRPARSPSAVTAKVTTSALLVSPPATPAPAAAASLAIPSASSRTHPTSRSPGPAKLTRSAVGFAPIAAMSARFLAAAFRPMSPAGDHSRRKCLPSISMSVVATTRPSAAVRTAASSPIPTITAGLSRNCRQMAAISANSPSSAIVMGASHGQGDRPSPAWPPALPSQRTWCACARCLR